VDLYIVSNSLDKIARAISEHAAAQARIAKALEGANKIQVMRKVTGKP
jgi:hypothetical protein